MFMFLVIAFPAPPPLVRSHLLTLRRFVLVWAYGRGTGNSLTATYFVSAFWHGFYPGYYLFFM